MTKNLRSSFRLLTLSLFAFTTLELSAQNIKSLVGANSKENDSNPLWIGDGKLLFTRAYHASNVGGTSDEGDIWMVEKQEDGEWSPAVHRPDLSTSGFDIALGFQNVITLLVYHKDESGKKGIHEYAKFGAEWNYRRKSEIPRIDQFEGIVGGFVADNQYLFLSGEISDGIGNEDLYVFEYKNSSWGAPESLGTAINTFGQEVNPYFDVDKGLLYFSTNNQPSAEGKDFFVAKKTGETWQDWSNPLKWEKISSAGSELGLSFVGPSEVVWVSSQNSNGFSDLLTFEGPQELNIPDSFEPALRRTLARAKPDVKSQQPTEVYKTEEKLKPIAPLIAVGKPELGIFIDSTKIEPQPVTWLAVDQQSKEKIVFSLEFLKNSSTVTLSDSVTQSELFAYGVDQVKVSSEGYFPITYEVSDLVVGQPNIALLTKISKGNSIRLDQVSFARGTANFEGLDTELSLKELSTYLLESDSVTVRIHGHTDNYGDPGLNKALSLDRARAVRDYLVSLGVPFERLRISGWGGTRPIASNATEAGRQKNRRVELEVQ